MWMLNKGGIKSLEEQDSEENLWDNCMENRTNIEMDN